MEYLREYQTFHNKDELNAAIKEHLSWHKYDLNDTDRDILLLISRYAVKYPGVADLKTETIAQAVGKSKRTVQRVIRKLERLGIIERLTFFRKIKGGYGANVYRVISPVSRRANVVEPCEPTDEQAENQNETNNLQSYKNKLHKETEESANSLRRSIPAPIYNAFAPYFNADDLYNVVGVLYRAKASVDRSITVEDYSREFIDAFKTVVFKYKRRRVRSLFGYLFATWRQVAIEIKRRMTLASSDIYYDWLV